MTPEEAQAKADAFKNELETVKEKLANAATKDDVTAINEAIEKLQKMEGVATKEQLDELKEINRKQGEALTQLKGKVSSKDTQSLFGAIKSQLEANKDKLETMKTDQNSKVSLDINLKAVAAMTFATHTTGDVGRVERESGIVDILRRRPTILDGMNVTNTNARIYEWIEKSGHEGGVEMVAEGAVKPQGDWDLTLYSQKPKKMALIVTVSKEMLDDIDGMAADIQAEIVEQIQLFAEEAAIDGDGTGQNIEGFDANATAFVAGGFANQYAGANEFDVLRAAINQVELNHDYPTAIYMHPTDAAKMELSRDSQGRYQMPPFVTANGTNIKGLPIRTSTAITQGEAYVGNWNRFKVKIRENITLDMGYRGAQGDWEKNMVSFLGEQRLFAFIPQNHYGSIVKVDFTVAKALLDPNVADS